MSLRTVAGEPMPPRPATEPEPTGWAVSTYSSTTARRMAARRSYTRSSIAGTRSYRVPRPAADLVSPPAGPRSGPGPPAAPRRGRRSAPGTPPAARRKASGRRRPGRGCPMADAPGTRPPGWNGSTAPRNGLGTAALVLGIIGFLLAVIVLGGLLGIVAIILGIVGLGRVRRGEATNRGSAIAGIVLGGLAVILTAILVIASATFISDNKEEFDDLGDCLDKATSPQDRDDCAEEFRDQIERSNQ